MVYCLPFRDEIIRKEKILFFGKCFYEAEIGQVIYESAEDALRAYNLLQEQEIKIFANTSNPDEAVAGEWIIKFAKQFYKMWRRTNAFAKLEETVNNSK